MADNKAFSDRQIREQLVNRGVESLSDGELLSILIRTGEGNLSAMNMAEALLNEFDGSLTKLARCELSRLRAMQQLGIGRAAVISAALELGRRYRADETFMRDTIETDRDVIDMFQPLLADLQHEEFWLICVSSSNRILDRVRISQGGVNGTVVDYRLVVKRALEKLAAAIILVHNHPSGNVEPSEQDLEMTRRIANAASLFDITVADHVIITAGDCYSFRNRGFFD